MTTFLRVIDQQTTPVTTLYNQDTDYNACNTLQLDSIPTKPSCHLHHHGLNNYQSTKMTTTNESTAVDYCGRLDSNDCQGAIVPSELWSIPEQELHHGMGHWLLSSSEFTFTKLGNQTMTTMAAMMLLLVLLLLVRYCIGFYKRSKSERSKHESIEMTRTRARKHDCLARVGDTYGYRGSKLGFIDDWRPIELPALQLPIDRHQRNNTIDSEREIYLDYAGAALPTKSQLTKICHDSLSILANPHSTGPAASRTTERIQVAKRRVLKHLHACPGKYASLQLPRGFLDSENNKNNAIMHRHPGYELVWTSGATEAFSKIADRFPFHEKSIFLYVTNSHNSVVGMRQLAIQKGATFHCMNMQDLEKMTTVSDWNKLEAKILGISASESTVSKQKRHLLVFPSECNFGGYRPDAESIVRHARASGWYTMLDIAKHSSTDAINLNRLDPDFAALSFYKWFGDPTGIGALLVRRPAIPVLFENQRKHYQGGGSVDVMLPNRDYTVPKSRLASLSNGTSHFRGIVNIVHGLDALESVGGMSAIHKHAICLTKELVERLSMLKHGNRMPVVQIYGAWSNANNNSSNCGPTVALNVYRSDGKAVGYNEVSKLGMLNKPPLQFRTGCFCNPGACQQALQQSDKQAIDNYQQLGHVCGDHIDLATNGTPTGAIRISFGKDSLWEDMDAFVKFIETSFRDSSLKNSDKTKIKSKTTTSKASVSELYLFPIKSCAAFRVSKWPLSLPTGKLRFDREFAIVDTTGVALRMQTCSRLGLISPTIDLQQETMRVSAPGFEDLLIHLNKDLYHGGENTVRVCGNRCSGRVWGDASVSEWFTEVLGIQCWLARYNNSSSSDSKPGFSNEQPILLVSEHAVATLNQVLIKQGQIPCTAKRFRPNIVIRDYHSSSDIMDCHIEDEWKQVSLGNDFHFDVQGGCPRCTMVDFDPTTGQKGKTLRALASYRRRNGHIVFGIFLRANASSQRQVVWIREGDTLDCN